MSVAAGTPARPGVREFTGPAVVPGTRTAPGAAHLPQRPPAGDHRLGRRFPAAASECRRSRELGRTPALGRVRGALPLLAAPGAGGGQPPLLGALAALPRSGVGLPVMVFSRLEDGRTRSLDWMDRPAAGAQPSLHRQSQSFPAAALGAGPGIS